MKQSRGERNNNPLNIRKSSTKWQGLRLEQRDSAFCEFSEVFYGFRAALVILRTYRDKYGVRTLDKVISRWAPSFENDTASYVSMVAGAAHMPKDGDIWSSRDRLFVVVHAMAVVENGYFNAEQWTAPLHRAVDAVWVS